MNITVQNLSKSFGEKSVIDGFSAVFHAGGTTCIMGPSGCGKTTLLFMLMGLIAPDTGTIEGVPERRSAVFQEDRLCEAFNAPANVRLACPTDVSREDIVRHLSDIGLRGSLNIPVRKLSGGMRRRVAIVRAVLAGGDVIFLDEPFKGLDAELKKDVIRYVKEKTAGKTVIVVTHDEDEAQEMGGDLIQMELLAIDS